MKLSNDTMNILKNFSSINTGIVFRQGNTLKTISTNKNVLAQANIGETIPSEFAVYDLSGFLTVLTMYDEPTLEFGDKKVIVSGVKSRGKTDYRFCDSSLVASPPEKEIAMPQAEVSFELTEQDLSWVMKSSAILSSPNIAFISDGQKISAHTFDAKNDGASTNTMEICDNTTGDTFKMIFKTETLKLIPDSYTVNLSSKGVAHFRSKSKDLQYWITIEPGSTMTKA